MLKAIPRKIVIKLGSYQRLHTTQLVILSFAIVIIVGTILLSLPISSNKGHLSFIDAFFTSTSAVCVTGLIVVDTAKDLSRFGQSVILLLIQLGGLGIMTFGVVFTVMLGRRINVKDRMLVQGTLYHSPLKDMQQLIRSVLIATISIELIGFAILLTRWIHIFPLNEAIFNALFHSVSAFCNAGFSTFSDSLVAFKGDSVVNFTIMVLIVLGGLGFLVHADVRNFVRRDTPRKQLSLHTKITLTFSAILIIVGALFILVIEFNNPETLGDLSGKERVLSAIFQSVTTRTAGFNTISIGALTNSVLCFMMFLMFVGASSGSTGGGIKVSTLAVLFAIFKSRISGKEEVSMFRRTIPYETRSRCLTIFVASIFVLIFFVIALSISESNNALLNSRGDFFELAFEAVSALGTAGLSTGITNKLSDTGRFLITCMMFIGRVGPLTVALAIGRKEQKGVYQYAEENIMVG